MQIVATKGQKKKLLGYVGPVTAMPIENRYAMK